MNVNINGYVAFTCSSCSKSYTHESRTFTFHEDNSLEADDDDYIRYLSKIDMRCDACANKIRIQFDVWEQPESVVNYSYYAVEGASGVQCEFDIEHYFDDQAVKQEDTQYDTEETAEPESEDDADEDLHDGPAPIESYMDRYDDED